MVVTYLCSFFFFNDTATTGILPNLNPLSLHDPLPILVEGDDLNEPIAEETRSILDGHIVLSQALGAANHYPAIDVLRSVSRVMHQVVSPAHRAAASQLRQWMACYEEVELLLRVGEYTRGQDLAVDQAIDKRDAIRAWLCQAPHERSSLQQSLEQLLEIARCP